MGFRSFSVYNICGCSISVRISLRRNPVVRDRLFMAVLAGAFAHGFYLVYPFFPICLLVITEFDSLMMQHDSEFFCWLSTMLWMAEGWCCITVVGQLFYLCDLFLWVVLLVICSVKIPIFYIFCQMIIYIRVLHDNWI